MSQGVPLELISVGGMKGVVILYLDEMRLLMQERCLPLEKAEDRLTDY